MDARDICIESNTLASNYRRMATKELLEMAQADAIAYLESWIKKANGVIGEYEKSIDPQVSFHCRKNVEELKYTASNAEQRLSELIKFASTVSDAA